MSKITKVICDNCNKEIDYKDWHYSVDITSQSTFYENGKQVIKGDYCKNCFKSLMVKKLRNIWRNNNEC